MTTNSSSGRGVGILLGLFVLLSAIGGLVLWLNQRSPAPSVQPPPASGLNPTHPLDTPQVKSPPIESAPMAPTLTGETPAAAPVSADAPATPAAATASPAPAGELTWEKINATTFSGRVGWDTYHPYYVIDADPIGLRNANEKIVWTYYGDEEPIEYHPDKEALINSSRVIDRRIRLAKQTPHTLKWELTFMGGPNVGLEPDGVVLGNRSDPDDFPVAPTTEHKLVLIRNGAELTLSVDDAKPHRMAVPIDDRTPLRVTGQVNPFVIRSAVLYFGKGEKLAPPPVRKPGDHPVRWVEVLHEDFAKPDSIQWFSIHPVDGRLAWNKEAQALDFGPENPKARPDSAYVLLHKSLPGDVRISFRARGINNFWPFFGMLVDLKGTLKKEDAYFIEWNYWQVQMKKKNVRVAGCEAKYGVENRSDWVRFRFEKIGDTLTMFTQDKEVQRWVDPHPYTDNDHDLFAFYAWRVPNQIDDLVIERNALDPIQPRADDPATPAHYLDGNRTEPAGQGEPEQDEF